MAATVTTETWDAAWTHVTRNIRQELTDNIFDEEPTLDYFRSAKAVEFEDGGSEFGEPLLYGKNTAQWFEGSDTLATAAVDGITMAFYTPRFVAVPITITFTEETKAQGHARIGRKLLESKAKQSMLTSRDAVGERIFSAASGKTMLGLQDIIKADPTTGTLGGINQANESWWRSQTNTSGGNFDGVSGGEYPGINSMASMFNNCSGGATMPDRIVTTLTLYSEWQRINISANYARAEANRAQGIGMDRNATFMGAPVTFDRNTASGKMYFLNSDVLKLKIFRNWNFAKTPFKEPPDQFAKVAFVIVGIQLVTNGVRRLGQIDFT